MAYFHGGGFSSGSAALTAISDRFVSEEHVVLVGVNHRSNVFGYTSLGGVDIRLADSGNVGQLDLIAALKWARDNIARFGGDPSNATIFGESSGGARVSTLLAMPGQLSTILKDKRRLEKTITVNGDCLTGGVHPNPSTPQSRALRYDFDQGLDEKCPDVC